MKYDLGTILLFSIIAVLSGATSYRKIERYIHNHRKCLNKLCNINWKRTPAHNSIRYPLQGLDAKEVEKSFREHSVELHEDSSVYGSISMDGKVLRVFTPENKLAQTTQYLVIYNLITMI